MSDTTSILRGQMREHIESGRTCLDGDFGFARRLIVKSDKTAADGSVLWDVFVRQDPNKETNQSASTKSGWHTPATPDPIGSFEADVP
jgi:hypothetical protein